MKNISFDNPYLLLLMIPIALAILIPFFISKNKDNKSGAWWASLFCHIAIILLIGLAAAGLSSITVLTKTTVYVVADVSHSSEQNLEKIDEYIAALREELPVNSTLGVVCFGKNSVLLTPAGRTPVSVKEAEVDDSATDIAAALSYTDSLFEADTIKRIVLITDGNDTTGAGTGALAATVSHITDKGVKLDAIFLDNSLGEDDTEVQLMDIKHTASTYSGRDNEATFLLQVSRECEVMLELFSRPLDDAGEPTGDYTRANYTVLSAERGLNTVKLDLPANDAATYEYRATVTANGDISDHNNTRTFVQTVVGDAKILLITGKEADRSLVQEHYGTKADITSYVIGGSSDYAPVTVEELIAYDEIVISNLDVRKIRNANAFVDSLDIAISQYGKSLLTLGNLDLHSAPDDPIFRKFEDLLPVNYGVTTLEGRMYTIVLDISHSLFQASKFTIVKNTAIQLLSVMEEQDKVCLVTFWGQTQTTEPATVKDCKQDLITYIDQLSTKHGTDIGLGLESALQMVNDQKLEENHVILISDGFSFADADQARLAAYNLGLSGATLSAINPYIANEGGTGRQMLSSIVSQCPGGKYYEISRPSDVNSMVFDTVANEIADVIVEKDSPVIITRYKNEPVISGFSSFPAVSGYMISMAKYDATVPLSITYLKPNGLQQTIPLYAYRTHGNGRVASFTSGLSESDGGVEGGWTRHWTDAQKKTFVGNLLSSNIPAERLEDPYTVTVNVGEYDTYFELVPALLDPDATVTLRITYPNGRRFTRELVFDSQKYFYTMETPIEGIYRMEVTYTTDDVTYHTTERLEVAYLPEYDAFAPFDRYRVYEFIRDNGTITEDGIPSLENDENEITTYRMSYAVPLLIAAIVLFLIDILLRKLRIGKKVKDRKKHSKEQKGASV